jgi:hypothetical protein
MTTTTNHLDSNTYATNAVRLIAERRRSGGPLGVWNLVHQIIREQVAFAMTQAYAAGQAEAQPAKPVTNYPMVGGLFFEEYYAELRSYRHGLGLDIDIDAVRVLFDRGVTVEEIEAKPTLVAVNEALS